MMPTAPAPDQNGADRDRHPLLAEGAGYGAVAADRAAARAGVGHFSQLGALLLGVGLPPLLEMPWAHAVSPPRLLLSAALLMAGTLLMTLRHRKE